MPDLSTWHYRGGLSDALAYNFDEDGNPYPVVYGEDYMGNPALITEKTPWYANLISQGIATTGNVFSGRGGGNFGPNYNAPAVTAAGSVSPAGVGGGFQISNQMLLIGGIVLAVFLLGKRK